MDEKRAEAYGQTGVIGRDGELEPEQRIILEGIQKKATETAQNYMSLRKPGEPHPLLAMATGIGKSKIMHNLVEGAIRKNMDARVLIIAGTKDSLVKQSHAALGKYQRATAEDLEDEDDYIETEKVEEETDGDEEISEEQTMLMEQSSFLYRTKNLNSKNPEANVDIATAQMVKSRMKRGLLNPDDYDLLIVDEAHNMGTPAGANVVKQFKNAVALTATPHRSSGGMREPEEYGFTAVETLSLPEAQEKGLLPPLAGVQIDTAEVIDEIPTKKDGSINYKKLEKLLKESPDLRPYIADKVASLIKTDTHQYKTVMAVNFIWEAQELAQLLKERGISVGLAVNKKASKEIHTDEIPALGTLDRYNLPQDDPNSIQVLISPRVASEGFDAPATEVLVWASPTDSALRYTQFTGRLARRARGKRYGMVIDCLYQTDQYRWSYNMAMWQKGEVKQLENGLLWLGRDEDIADLSNLPEMLRMLGQTSKKNINDLDLAKKAVSEDFIINQKTMQATFSATGPVLSEVTKKTLLYFRTNHPELLLKKKNGTRDVEICTDPVLFKQKMIEYGVKLKPEGGRVSSEDFILDGEFLDSTFYGHDNLPKLVSQAAANLNTTNPNTVSLKINGRNFSYVTNNPDAFNEEMVRLGAVLRSEYEEEGEGSLFILSKPEIRGTFVGRDSLIYPMVNAAFDIIQNARPELIGKTLQGKNTVRAVKDKSVFIAEMVRLGAVLRDNKE